MAGNKGDLGEGVVARRAAGTPVSGLTLHSLWPVPESALARAVWESKPYIILRDGVTRWRSATWSPDGKHIAFTRWQESTDYHDFALGEEEARCRAALDLAGEESSRVLGDLCADLGLAPSDRHRNGPEGAVVEMSYRRIELPLHDRRR